MPLVSISQQFQGLRMDSLIGGPLKAACDAQVALAKSTIDFIKEVGFEGEDCKDTRMVDFSFNRTIQKKNEKGDGIDLVDEKIDLKVPMLAIVNVPCLIVDNVGVTFDMEVKSLEASTQSENMSLNWDAKAKFNEGLFSVDVNVNGSISSHKENTRSSDSSAKYHIAVLAKQGGTPEGFCRVLDIISASVAPKPVKSADSATQPSGT